MDLLNSDIKINEGNLDLLILKSVFLLNDKKYQEVEEFLLSKKEFNIFKKNPRIDTAAFFILTYSYLTKGMFEKALNMSNTVLNFYHEHYISYLTGALVHGYNLIYKFKKLG